MSKDFPIFIDSHYHVHVRTLAVCMYYTYDILALFFKHLQEAEQTSPSNIQLFTTALQLICIVLTSVCIRNI